MPRASIGDDGKDNGFDTIPFSMHPRVFAALGADLITNDVVAVIELVKNSYDAFASKAKVAFRTDKTNGSFLEIEDDGLGMTKKVIEDAWCVVATPYKEENPYVKSGKERRRVAGEKGLGRLSAARLGKRMQMITQAPDSPCWEAEVDWEAISVQDKMSACCVRYRKFPGPSPFSKSGTRIRVFGLKSVWDEDRISDLEENLGRLISPFADVGDFCITILPPGNAEAQPAKITSPEFLAKPKYSIKGEVDAKGKVKANYAFAPIRDGKGRTTRVECSWEQILDAIKDRARFEPIRYPFPKEKPHCGPFSFEIRAWDIGAEDTQQIHERFDFQKSKIRKAIRAHKGISVYRDAVLVLPKSDNARDWLGLDLRRVSKVGTRLSTTQLVGYVAISAENNPRIGDTSDRERLASGLDVAEFEEILKAIVYMLENERDIDRMKLEKKKPLEHLFGELNAEALVTEVNNLADEGAPASEALPVVRDFSARLDLTRKTIQESFTYYSRLATVGTIAQILVHEIRNRTTAFGSFLRFVKDRFGPFKDKEMTEEYNSAYESAHSLERLADTFAPLASRGFRRLIRHSVLEERIGACVSLQKAEISRKGIECTVPQSETHVAVDPGELDAIILNLTTNAIYWLGQVGEGKRRIQFHLTHLDGGKRVRVWIEDSGPGIQEEDREKVFWPGFTKKPGGIGMGLTVASELVAEYGGAMLNQPSGSLGGASFAFDIPLRKE